jgi:hypothetical protein
VIALVVGPSPALSSLSLLLLMVTVVPIGLMFAPQPIRRDKRVLIGIGLLVVLFGLSSTASAAVIGTCKYAWWAIECWFV